MRNNEVTLPEATDKKPGKLFIIISYVIALASLIAMLFVPLFDGKMFIQYVLSAVAPILDLFKVTIPAEIYGEFFIKAEYTLTLGIMYTMVYVSVILALIMLIPVIACKAAKGTNLRCAFAAEHIAFLFLLANVCYDILSYSFLGLREFWYDYSLLIPLGVLMLVMAAQSIKYKGGSGVAKFIIFLLSLVTLFCLFDIATFIPKIEDLLVDIAGIVNAYNADATFIGSSTIAINPFIDLCNGAFVFVGFDNLAAALYQLIALVLPMLLMVSIFLDTIGLVAGKKTKADGKPNAQTGWFVIAAIRYSLIILLIAAAIALSFLLEGFGQVGIYMYITAVLVLLTFIVEIIRFCVGKSKAKAFVKARKKSQEEEFRSETLVIMDESLTPAPDEEPAPALTEIAEEEEVIEVSNVTDFTQADEQVETAQPVEEQTDIFGYHPTFDEPVEETEAEPVVENTVENDDQQLTIMDAQPIDETEEIQPDVVIAEPVSVDPVEQVVTALPEDAVINPVDEQTTLNIFGETQSQESQSIDPFIDKLTDEERAQFYDVFINRNKGKFSSIPVYQINGNNSDFFPSVFVHINRMRILCSDSLLSKIYKEIGND
ncbi:MAG: hypothetical protein ACI4VK_05860 [Candidatus Coproplasma sp.]